MSLRVGKVGCVGVCLGRGLEYWTMWSGKMAIEEFSR